MGNETTNLDNFSETYNADDVLLQPAIKLCMIKGEANATYLQRKLGIGYSRASRLLDIFERKGYISPTTGSKSREVLITPEQYKQDFNEEFDSVDN